MIVILKLNEWRRAMDFSELFIILLEKVAELLPEKEKVGGLTIYSSEDGCVRIPVAITKPEIETWLAFYDPENRKFFRETLEKRLALIDPNTIRLIDADGKSQFFSHQLIINNDPLSEAIEAFEKEFAELKPTMSQDHFVEARLVSYVCYVLRHLAQIYFPIEPKDFFSIFEKSPKLENNIFPQKKLKQHWFLKTKSQLKQFHKRRIERSSVAIEKDAMYIQLLAFDCWIRSDIGYQEKILKLQKILWQKNKR